MPDGTLLVTYVRYFDTTRIMLARSTDGGSFFSAPQLISNYIDLGPFSPPDSAGYPNIGPPDSALGINSFPSIAADQSFELLGRAYVTWCAKGSDNVPHVWLAISDNDGASWSAPRIIDNDGVSNAHSRFFPWVAVDPSNGAVGIAYYVATMNSVAPKQNGGTQMLEASLFLSRSKDNGATFKTRQVSSVWFDPITGQDARSFSAGDVQFFGDYIGLAGMNGMWHPVWCDARSGDAEIYTAAVPDSAFDQNADVAEEPTRSGLALSFSRQPAIARAQCAAIATSERAATVELRLYDEVGRLLGAPIVDGRLAREHELRFTPGHAGVLFYILTEYATNGQREIVGKVGVIER